MNYRNLAIATAVVTCLFGLAFVLVPGATLQGYRLGLNLGVPDAQHLSLSRIFGASLIMTAGLSWAVREAQDAGLRSSIARFAALTSLLGALVSVYSVVVGAVNALGWSSVALYVIFALLWARLGWRTGS